MRILNLRIHTTITSSQVTFIVENAKLRKLLSQGPKYSEPKQLDFISAKSEILKGIDNCIENYCDRYHLDKVVLKAWKVEIVKAIDERIDEVTPRLEFDPVTETLQDPSCRKSLLNLQNRFVIAPIDKATGNVSFICKRFYAEVLVKELELVGEKSDTYQSIRKNCNTIVQSNKKDLKKNLESKFPRKMKNYQTSIGCLSFTRIH